MRPSSFRAFAQVSGGTVIRSVASLGYVRGQYRCRQARHRPLGGATRLERHSGCSAMSEINDTDRSSSGPHETHYELTIPGRNLAIIAGISNPNGPRRIIVDPRVNAVSADAFSRVVSRHDRMASLTVRYAEPGNPLAHLFIGEPLVSFETYPRRVGALEQWSPGGRQRSRHSGTISFSVHHTARSTR